MKGHTVLSMMALAVTAACTDSTVTPVGPNTVGLSASTSQPAGSSGQRVTFDFVGQPQPWVVPNGVTSVTVDVRGAQGGGNGLTVPGGKGGHVQTTLAVTPGETLMIYVGGRGGDLMGPNIGGPGGFNGGGAGGIDNVDFNAPAGGGGGASDIRQGGQDLANRVVVAGGGGGSACCFPDGGSGPEGPGGDGGGLIGATGGTTPGGGSNPGGGGTQSEGGAGGAGCNGSGTSSSLGQGGVGGNGNRAGGGGGGGYYGGGGGGGCLYGSGGGGGSSYSADQGAVHTQGYQTGAGQVLIGYEVTNQPPVAKACIVPTTFVIPTDPVPTDCSHLAKVHGYHGPNSGGTSDPPGTFPPNIVLRGADSFDPDGDAIDYVWTAYSSGEVLGTEANLRLTGQLGPGLHEVLLTVDDGSGGAATDRVSILVSDLVILVHGWHGGPRITFGVGIEVLAQEFSVLAYDYGPESDNPQSACGIHTSITELAVRGTSSFGHFVQELLGRASPYSGRINVLAHSMGGLVTRRYMVDDMYQGEFNRVVTSGTPNYGLDRTLLGNILTCTIKRGRPAWNGDQEKEMTYSSDFVWQLHDRWNSRQPIDARNIVSLTGQLDIVTGELGDGDGVTQSWSAALPFERMFSVAYVPFAHIEAPTGLLGLVHLRTPNASNRLSYDAITAFFTSGNVLVGVREPVPALNSGLLLVRFTDMATGAGIDLSRFCSEAKLCTPSPLEAEGAVPDPLGSRSLGCSLKGITVYRLYVCRVNAASGILTFTNLHGTQYTVTKVNVPGYRVRSAPSTFAVFGGRPTAVEIVLESAR